MFNDLPGEQTHRSDGLSTASSQRSTQGQGLLIISKMQSRESRGRGLGHKDNTPWGSFLWI